MVDYMLTTTDNPFNPHTQWDDWKRYDEDNGYFTCEYLARVVRTSDKLSDADYEIAVQDAIEEICMMNVTGNYKKISATEL